MKASPGNLCHVLWEVEPEELAQENTDILATEIVVSKSFVPHLGMPCLASIHEAGAG